MIPDFDDNGNLPLGIHRATWREIDARFGQTLHRQRLLEGLRTALESLKAAGCKKVYLDGSFVTDREVPGDFDGCWEANDVDPTRLDPVLLEFANGRAAQKAKFFGELFIAEMRVREVGKTFLDFFQQDKESGSPKGIIALNLQEL